MIDDSLFLLYSFYTLDFNTYLPTTRYSILFFCNIEYAMFTDGSLFFLLWWNGVTNWQNSISIYKETFYINQYNLIWWGFYSVTKLIWMQHTRCIVDWPSMKNYYIIFLYATAISVDIIMESNKILSEVICHWEIKSIYTLLYWLSSTFFIVSIAESELQINITYLHYF